MVFKRASKRAAHVPFSVQQKTPLSQQHPLGSLTAEGILHMQRTIGNRATGHWLLTNPNMTTPPAQLGRRKQTTTTSKQTTTTNKKTRKRKQPQKRTASDAFDDSDIEVESDDDKQVLTTTEQMQILVKHGKRKKQKLLSEGLKQDDDSTFLLDSQRARKVFAAHRSSQGKSELSDISKVESFKIGDQYHNIANGTGYFVTAGGNDRPDGVSEPPTKYATLFESMLNFGKDPYAAELFKRQTNQELERKKKLDDHELAASLLYYLNHDANEIHNNKLGRTQFIENANKFSAITSVAELSRSLQSDQNPFDATLFVKQGLTQAMEGKHTLQDIFYKGPKGKDSLFLGAPTDGGADMLKNPFDPSYSAALERQMSLFPKNKGEFKASLRRLKSNGKDTTRITLTAKQKEALRKKRRQEKVVEAQQLLEQITDIPLPEKIEHVQEFVMGPSGAVKKYQGKIDRLRTHCQGNAKALRLLREAEEQLQEKSEEAQEINLKKRVSKQVHRYQMTSYQ